jgi:hypothetical protein
LRAGILAGFVDKRHRHLHRIGNHSHVCQIANRERVYEGVALRVFIRRCQLRKGDEEPVKESGTEDCIGQLPDVDHSRKILQIRVAYDYLGIYNEFYS